MTRWKAALLHLALSVLVIGSIVVAMFALWYPYALHQVVGVGQLLWTMAGVDIVVGPLLTLLVYKTGKPSLRFDLTVIGVLQAAFLAYALHTAWISRPVFLVWAVDHMSLLFANDIRPADLAKGTQPDTRTLSWTGPRLYATTLPKDSERKKAIFTDLIRSQTSIDRLPQYYGSYANARAPLLRFASSVEDWRKQNPATAQALSEAVAASGRQSAQLRVVPIESARNGSGMLVDAKTAAPVRVLAPLQP